MRNKSTKLLILSLILIFIILLTTFSIANEDKQIEINKNKLETHIIQDTSKTQKEDIESIIPFLKQNLEATAIQFEGKTINVEIPIKVEYKVMEAPPAVRGDTAQGGSKTVVIETGASINAPLFVEEGDIIIINTQTGQYTERAKK